MPEADQVGHVADRPVGLHHQTGGVGHDVADVGEAVEVVLRAALHGHGDEGRHVGQPDHMPVRSGARDIGQRDLGGGAGAVHHRDRLAEPRFEMPGEEPRHDVGAAAGAEADHEFHRPVRAPRRGDGGRGEGRGGQGADGGAAGQQRHAVLLGRQADDMPANGVVLQGEIARGARVGVKASTGAGVDQ
jgi:hypothetical protein